MADPLAESALSRIQGLFGIRSTGISGETTRALIEHGELTPSEPAAISPVEAAPMVAGPQPSPELLERVRLQQEQKSAESFKRIMEQRRRALGTP